MLDDSDETGEPRVRFYHTVNVKEVSPDRSASETDRQPGQRLSMETIQEDIVRLSGLPNQSSSSNRQQHKASHNSSSKTKHSSDKLYSYPLSNFMKDSTSLCAPDDTQNTRTSPPRKDSSKSPVRTSTSPSRVANAFKSMGSRDFMNSDDDDVVEVNVQREPESRIRLDHHVWAEPTREDGDVEVRPRFLVFRKKDLYLIITQNLTFHEIRRISYGFHEIRQISWISYGFHEIWRISYGFHEIWWISPMKSGGFHEICEIQQISGEIQQISPRYHL